MKETTITVTEAARNFADCVNRAHYQGASFVLLKNGRPFARIEPDNEKRCTGRALAEALSGAELSVEEACDWHGELRTARETLPAPTDKWQ
jgi:antitoxin (DNA-binding transcriptional repressor) of toxin-antitoxin stability system